MFLLTPDGVGHVQTEPRTVLRRLLRPQGEVEGVKGGMEPVLGQIEPQSLRHLPLRLAPGPGVSHGKGCRDAVRRKEQVALSTGQRAIEIEGERIVASSKGLEIRFAHVRSRVSLFE